MRRAVLAPGDTGSVDKKMREIHTLLLLHARIGCGEEAAVRARLADIDRVAFTPIRRRAAVRDSLVRLRDSIAAANGLRRR